MNAPAVIPNDPLPALIDRASRVLAEARSSAEVLEARDLAKIAYDAAKAASRMARAKGAHDAMVAAAHRLQADALLIEARAKMRLADEYDAAQERGEVAKSSVRTDIVPAGNDVRPATAADLGISRKEVHEARQLRDAEKREPGLLQRTLDQMVRPTPTPENPRPKTVEPTRAEVRRSILDAVKDAQRRPSFRNPLKVKDPGEEAYTDFVGACRTIEEADVEALARWQSYDVKVRNLRTRAGAARDALNRFLSLGGSHA